VGSKSLKLVNLHDHWHGLEIMGFADRVETAKEK